MPEYEGLQSEPTWKVEISSRYMYGYSSQTFFSFWFILLLPHGRKRSDNAIEELLQKLSNTNDLIVSIPGNLHHGQRSAAAIRYTYLVVCLVCQLIGKLIKWCFIGQRSHLITVPIAVVSSLICLDFLHCFPRQSSISTIPRAERILSWVKIFVTGSWVPVSGPLDMRFPFKPEGSWEEITSGHHPATWALLVCLLGVVEPHVVLQTIAVVWDLRELAGKALSGEPLEEGLWMCARPSGQRGVYQIATIPWCLRGGHPASLWEVEGEGRCCNEGLGLVKAGIGNGSNGLDDSHYWCMVHDDVN
jgi:hypothetical protein